MKPRTLKDIADNFIPSILSMRDGDILCFSGKSPFMIDQLRAFQTYIDTWLETQEQRSKILILFLNPGEHVFPFHDMLLPHMQDFCKTFLIPHQPQTVLEELETMLKVALHDVLTKDQPHA